MVVQTLTKFLCGPRHYPDMRRAPRAWAAGPFSVSTDVRAAPVPGSGAGGLRRLSCVPWVAVPVQLWHTDGLDLWGTEVQAMQLSAAGLGAFYASCWMDGAYATV